MYRFVGLVLALAVAVFALRAPADAADIFPVGTTGYDVSFPQCNGPLPALPYAFAIVGATGGRAFTTNACLPAQYTWASANGRQPSLYMNLKSPVGSNAEEALSGPLGACQPTDEMCKGYNFGWKTAAHAVAYAKAQSATPASWWLDIETTSSWLTDTNANARVIQGAIDFLKPTGVTLGIYSNPGQWQTIAGNFSPGLPVWTTTAAGAVEAPSLCSRPFGGGQVVLVQYLLNNFDANYACRVEDRVATPVPTTPLGPAGSSATIAAEGDCLNLRATPSVTGPLRTCLATGTGVTLLDGSVVADGLKWQLVSAGPQNGWVASAYLRAGAAVITPPPGTFAGTPVFGPSRQSLVVFNGGTVDQLEASAIAIGATGIWAQESNGAYQLFVVRGPVFVNAAFRNSFPPGLKPSTALTLTK